MGWVVWFVQSFRRQVAALIAVVALGTVIVLAWGIPWAEQQARTQLEAEIDEVIALQKVAINGNFDKFRLLTGVAARRPSVAAIFSAPVEPQSHDRARSNW